MKKYWLFPVVCILSLLSCNSIPATPPTILNPTPSLTSAAPEAAVSPIPVPDLVWVGEPYIETLLPIVGDKLQIQQHWENRNPEPDSDFEIRLEIKHEDTVVYEEYVKAPPAVATPGSNLLEITLDYPIPEPGLYQIFMTLDGKSVLSEVNENNNVSQSNIIEIPNLSLEPSYSKEPDTATIAQATSNIGNYRKGNVVLDIVDATGQPLNNLTVDFEQINHSFLFGAFSPSPNSHDKIWRSAQQAGINYTTIQFPWAQLESSPGSFFFKSGATNVLHHYGFTGMGHQLMFFTYLWNNMPFYTTRYSFDELKTAVYEHVFHVVDAYKDDIAIWNVLNEPMYQNELNLTSEQTIEVIQEGIRAIRDADPTSKILINVFNAGNEIPGPDQYEFMKELVQSNTDFDIIGLEFYYNSYMSDYNQMPRRTLTGMVELIDQYSALGKKIIITEFSVPSESHGDFPGYWNQPWSEELQAEYLKTAYSLFFSRPQVEGITWWDITDSTSFISHGALFKNEDTPKRSFLVLKTLLKSWMTSGTSLTDDNGQISFRGFGGEYEIIITDTKTGYSKKQVIAVEEQKDNSMTLIFE
jgi:endo-1,4-beta-xylanase